MTVKMGKAKYGSNNFQRKYFKLKDGEQAYRILPPIGELADSGRWSVFHSVHYGYKTTDGKQKPFLSPEVKNRKTGVVEVRDAAKLRIEVLKADYENAKKTGNKVAFERLDKLVGPTGMYNLDNNHYMNVIDAQGNVGILKLRHRAKLALEAEIKKLNSEGVDPLSPEDGRYFVFSRSGMGRDTVFAVRVLKEKMNVQGVGNVERDVVHKLDNELINRLGTEAAELNSIFKRLAAEEVARVVETSNLEIGTSPYMDELFGKSKTQESSDDDSDGHDDTETTQTTTNKQQFVQNQPVPQAASAQTVTAQLHQNQSVAQTTTTQTASKVTSMTDLSNEEFLAKLNAGAL